MLQNSSIQTQSIFFYGISDCITLHSIWKFTCKVFRQIENWVSNFYFFFLTLKLVLKFLYLDGKQCCIFFSTVMFSQCIKTHNITCHTEFALWHPPHILALAQTVPIAHRCLVVAKQWAHSQGWVRLLCRAELPPLWDREEPQNGLHRATRSPQIRHTSPRLPQVYGTKWDSPKRPDRVSQSAHPATFHCLSAVLVKLGGPRWLEACQHDIIAIYKKGQR